MAGNIEKQATESAKAVSGIELRKDDTADSKSRDAGVRSFTPKEKLTREELERMYIEQRMSIKRIANETDTTPKTVIKYLRSAGIRTRKSVEAKRPASFKKPTDDEIKDLYLQQGIGKKELMKRFRVGGKTLDQWLKESGIRKRTPSEAMLPPWFKTPDKKTLEKWYVEIGMSANAIAKNMGISHVTVINLLKKAGIKRRQKGLPEGFVNPTEDALREMYEGQRMTKKRMAEVLGVSVSKVHSMLKKTEIRIRGVSEAKLPKGFVKPTDTELKDWYVEGHMTAKEIAKRLNVSSELVVKMLKDADIQVRGVSEAKLPKGFVKPTEEELNKMREKRMSIVDIAKQIGVSKGTVAKLLKDAGIK